MGIDIQGDTNLTMPKQFLNNLWMDIQLSEAESLWSDTNRESEWEECSLLLARAEKTGGPHGWHEEEPLSDHKRPMPALLRRNLPSDERFSVSGHGFAEP